MKKKLDEKHIPQDKHYEANAEEIGAYCQAIQTSQEELTEKLVALEKKNTVKNSSESYRTGFDSSHLKNP